MASFSPQNKTVAFVAGGVLVAAFLWSYAGTVKTNASLRGELGALKSQYLQTRGSLDDFMKREEERARAREIAERNLRNLRKSFLTTTSQSHAWEGERNEIVETASEISRERERAEAAAQKAENEAQAHKQNVARLSTDLAKTRREKEAAEASERQKQAAVLQSQNRMRDLVGKIKSYEAKESDYEKAIAEYDEVQREATRATDLLRAADRRLEEYARENAVAHYNLGVLQAKQGQYRPAALEFERSIARDPNDPLAHYNLGLLYDSYLENPEGARREYEIYLRLLPAASDASDVRRRLHEVKLQQEVGLGRDLNKNKF